MISISPNIEGNNWRLKWLNTKNKKEEERKIFMLVIYQSL